MEQICKLVNTDDTNQENNINSIKHCKNCRILLKKTNIMLSFVVIVSGTAAETETAAWGKISFPGTKKCNKAHSFKIVLQPSLKQPKHPTT